MKFIIFYGVLIFLIVMEIGRDLCELAINLSL